MKNKQTAHISKIMSKDHGIFTENFTVFLSNAGKNGKLLEFEFDIF